MLNKKKNNKGFTLVELLVVIAIIGILAVVAVPALFKNIEKGKVAELESDISAIRSAALSYYADNGIYPNEVVAISSNDDTAGDLEKTGDSLAKEIESLSNPFDANYIVGEVEADGTPNNDNPATPPDSLILKINAPKLSTDGLSKLINDLGDVMVTGEDSSNIEVIIISAN